MAMRRLDIFAKTWSASGGSGSWRGLAQAPAFVPLDEAA